MIVLPEEQLQKLEKKFGPDVRHMGTWNSDGVFGFCAIPLTVVEKAAEAVGNPRLAPAMDRLKASDNPAEPFLDMVQSFGSVLVHAIAARYRQQARASIQVAGA